MKIHFRFLLYVTLSITIGILSIFGSFLVYIDEGLHFFSRIVFVVLVIIQTLLINKAMYENIVEKHEGNIKESK
jgi:hypothetical protein